jgi:F-type H+-transporting ATPase subunit delta
VSGRSSSSFAEAFQDLTHEEREEFAAFSKFYETDEEFRRFLKAPHLSTETKQELIRKALEPLCTKRTIENLLFLESQNSLELLPSILIRLEDRKGVANGVLTSAEPLSQDTALRLKARFEEMTGQKIILEQKTDPSLIGGFLINIENRVYDSTIKHSLQNLKKYLGKSSCH